ncbi:MAG: PAS domain-containing protein [Rhizomicrobium sp.]
MVKCRIEDFNAWAERDGWETRVDGTLNFRSPKLKECLAVWTRAAAGKPLPMRADLTPRAMKTFLSSVIVWDVLGGESANRFRLRVMGSQPQRIWGGKAGDFIDEVVPEPFRARWHRIAQLCLDLRAPLRSHGIVQFANRTYFQSETFQAPLAGEGDAPDAILFVHIVEPKAYLPAAPTGAGMPSHHARGSGP